MPLPLLALAGAGMMGGSSAYNIYQTHRSERNARRASRKAQKAYAKAYRKAQIENDRRLTQITSMYNEGRKRALKLLDNSGASQKADINESARQANASAGQSLVSRGLAGTTIANTMATGVERARNQDLTRLQEAVNQQRLGVDADWTQGLAGVLERVNNPYPDSSQLIELQRQAAALDGATGRAIAGMVSGAGGAMTGGAGGNAAMMGILNGSMFSSNQPPAGSGVMAPAPSIGYNEQGPPAPKAVVTKKRRPVGLLATSYRG